MEELKPLTHCGHAEAGWCYFCVENFSATIKRQAEEIKHLKQTIKDMCEEYHHMDCDCNQCEESK